MKPKASKQNLRPSPNLDRVRYSVWLDPEDSERLALMTGSSDYFSTIIRLMIQAAFIQYQSFRETYPDFPTWLTYSNIDADGKSYLVYLRDWYDPNRFQAIDADWITKRIRYEIEERQRLEKLLDPNAEYKPPTPPPPRISPKQREAADLAAYRAKFDDIQPTNVEPKPLKFDDGFYEVGGIDWNVVIVVAAIVGAVVVVGWLIMWVISRM